MILSKDFFSKQQNKVLKLLNSRIWKPLKPNFLKKLPDPYGVIIAGTKITNTGNFLWNGSSKIQFFTNIWHPF